MYQQRFLFCTLIAIFYISCTDTDRGTYYQISGFAQGTIWNITYESGDSVNLRMDVDSILKVFDLSFSVYEPNSVISKVNTNVDVEVDDDFRHVFNTAKKVWTESGGYFDITVMPLVDVWGFGPGEKQDIDDQLVDSILQFVGMEKVRIENNRVVKSHPSLRLDMNAIAKGYAVDIVCGYFDSLGLKNYMVEIGGELKTKGVNPSGSLWKIGVDKPSYENLMPGQQLQLILELSDLAMATSGNYRNYYEEDGVKYAHSIDPITGYPVRHNLLSVTIVAKECKFADAWATACMVMGLEKSIKILEKQRDIQAYLIYSDEKGQYRGYFTEGLRPYIFKEL